MVGRSWMVLAVALSAATPACNETYIDLTPDAEQDAATPDIPADVGVLLPPPPCGNGVVESGEECDDGNLLDGDGCTWDCRGGAGEPPGPPDPTARAYRAEASQVLPAIAAPPEPGSEQRLALSRVGDLLAGSWYRAATSAGDTATVSTRFLAEDGSSAREDVTIRLATGWTASWLTSAAAAESLLLAWRASDDDGIWKAGLTLDEGLADPPEPLVTTGKADLPALAGHPAGYHLAWYEGTDTRVCEHDSPEPSTVLVRRLGADGSTAGLPAPIVLEERLGARTAPDLAAGDDGTVGILWWRAATEVGGTCTLRFGVGDRDLLAVADGGAVGPGRGGRVVDAERGYRAIWHDVDPIEEARLGVAAFDRDGLLLRAPAVTRIPATSLMGDVEVAAGDGGLTIVLRGYESGPGLRLLFLRTDLFGRVVGTLEQVDPTCTPASGCTPGAFNVAPVAGGFLVLFFAEVDSGGPTPTTELRMVRLVPGS